MKTAKKSRRKPGLTRKETDALRLVYFAMRMRFNARRPPAPTKEQYALIQSAHASLPISKKIWDKLEAQGLTTREMGSVVYLTPKALALVFPPSEQGIPRNTNSERIAMKLYRAWFVCECHLPPIRSCPNGGGILYENQPNGNLVGNLPAGARAQNDSGTLNRKDGGDPFEYAIFIIPPTAGQAHGRTVIVERQE